MTLRVVVKDRSGREIVVFEELEDPSQGGARVLATTFCDSSVSEARWRKLERLAAIEWARRDGAADLNEPDATVIDLTDEDAGQFGPPSATPLGPWATD